MSCFRNLADGDFLRCRSCEQELELSEGNVPRDLFSLLSKYDLPQIHWFCKECNKWRVTQNDIKSLDSRIADLEADLRDMRTQLSRSGREIDIPPRYSDMSDNTTPRMSRSRDSSLNGSSSLAKSGSTSPNQQFYHCSFNSGDRSPPSSRSADRSPPRNRENKDANFILNNIINTGIKIDKHQAQNSINVINAFMLEIIPFLKKQDLAFKFMFSREYKTGSSFNDLKISSANEYDINIQFVLKDPFKLEVEFFKETMAFAKIKWSKTKEINESSESEKYVLKFLQKNSSKDGYLNPDDVRAWFHSLVDKFCLNNPSIKGVEKIVHAQSGPARTIRIHTQQREGMPKYRVDLDLVPVFVFGFDVFDGNPIPRLSEYTIDKVKQICSFVPKICGGEERLLASDCKLSWRIYVPELDRRVWYEKQCAKPIIKLLKLLRDKNNWASIASYHLATVVLWQINENPNDWGLNVLYDQFLKALEKLQMYLNRKNLPYFLYPQYNLFHSLNEDECNNLSNRINTIIKQLNSDYNKLYSVFQMPNSRN